MSREDPRWGLFINVRLPIGWAFASSRSWGVRVERSEVRRRLLPCERVSSSGADGARSGVSDCMLGIGGLYVTREMPLPPPPSRGQ